jgi:hypothetical protein
VKNATLAWTVIAKRRADLVRPRTDDLSVNR